MTTQPNVFNSLFNPLQVQQFQRYLPTAFDEGFTLLQKVDKLIVSMNQIGKLSNDVLDQWNQVMDWVMADGLDASINAKIDSMLQDGSLATIIGNAITNLGAEIGDLTTLSTTAKDSIVHAINELLTTLNAKTGDLNTLSTTAKDSIVHAINEVLADIASNKTTIETDLTNGLATKAFKYYGTPEEYGAKGDGFTDDTTAIQACLNACMVTNFNPVSYVVTKTLTLPKYHSIQGNHAELAVLTNFTPNTIGASVPPYTILYVATRGQVFQEELSYNTQFIKDLRIKGNTNFPNQTGIYMGVPDRNGVSQATSVNFSVTGGNFSNISISICKDALVLSEVWQCNFDNIQTSYLTNNGLSIIGQSVNNTFKGCFFGTASQGLHGVYITSGVYSGSTRRPEGNMFFGGFIGSAQIGVRIFDSFVAKFSNIIIDINSVEAVLLENMYEDTVFENCYFFSTGAVCVNIADATNSNYSQFKGCNFTGSTDNAIVGLNQIALFDGCEGTNKITFASSARGSVINGIWNQITTANPQIIKNGANVYTNNNIFKLDGSAVVVG